MMPRITIRPENTNAYWRLPMKSMFVFPKISNIERSLRQARSESPSLNAQLLDLVSLIDDVEDDFRADQCREQIDRDAQTQRHGESLDWPSSEEKQRDPGDQRRHVGIDDGQQRLVVAPVDREPHTLTAPQLFPDPLENQHVRIHAHADGQHDAGN